MEKEFSFRFFVFVFFLFTRIISINSQTTSEIKDYYKLFDSIVGHGNIGIYDGTEHIVEYVTLKGNHQYYFTSDYLVGDVIYDDQPYYDIRMKYDIYNDELIVRLPNGLAFIVIELIKEKVKSFSLNNTQFNRIAVTNKVNLVEENYGFCELLYKSDHLSLYKKHKKLRTYHLDKEFAYNKFNYKNEYLIYYKDKYHDIKSKRTFIQLFPEHRKQINSFFNKNKILFKSYYEMFIMYLMKSLSKNIADNKKVS